MHLVNAPNQSAVGGEMQTIVNQAAKDNCASGNDSQQKKIPSTEYETVSSTKCMFW